MMRYKKTLKSVELSRDWGEENVRGKEGISGNASKSPVAILT